MKIRTGFVSNSSSSSFIVAYRGKKLSRQKMLDLFGIVPGKPGEKVFGPLMELLFSGNILPLDSILKDYGYKTVEEAEAAKNKYCLRQVRLAQEGLTLSEIRIDNNEQQLRELLSNVDTPDFKIIAEE